MALTNSSQGLKVVAFRGRTELPAAATEEAEDGCSIAVFNLDGDGDDKKPRAAIASVLSRVVVPGPAA